MDALFQKIQKTYDFSDYQIRVLKYVIIGNLSDGSKMLFLFILFDRLQLMRPFLCALVPFLLLRQLTGGLHCKTYLGCFLATLGYFLSVTILMPLFMPLSSPVRSLLLVVCMYLGYRLGPLLSNRELHITPRAARIKKYASLLLIGAYLLLDIGLAQEPYHIYGIYTIYLHTVQLVYSKLVKEVKSHEELIKSCRAGIL